MKVHFVTLARASEASSYRIYTEKLANAVNAAVPGTAGIETIAAAAEARRGGVLRPTFTHFVGRFPRDGVVRHATEPNAALRGVDVVTLHDLYPFYGRGLMQAVFRAVIRSAVRRAPGVVAISAATRDDVGRFLGPAALAKTSVVPPPFPSPPAGREPVRYDLLWVGSVDPRKHPDRFLGGLAALEGPRRRVAFLCHRAPGPLTAAVEAALPAARARHDIEWIDRNVSDAELEALYRSSRALVSTSSLEGYHYPVMEAWSRGTRVVLPEIPLYRQLYGGVAGVHYYAPSGGFGEAVAAALEGPPFTPDPGLLAQVSYSGVGRQLLDLYRALGRGA